MGDASPYRWPAGTGPSASSQTWNGPPLGLFFLVRMDPSAVRGSNFETSILLGGFKNASLKIRKSKKNPRDRPTAHNMKYIRRIPHFYVVFSSICGMVCQNEKGPCAFDEDQPPILGGKAAKSPSGNGPLLLRSCEQGYCLGTPFGIRDSFLQTDLTLTDVHVGLGLLIR